MTRDTCAAHDAAFCLDADCRMIERAGALVRMLDGWADRAETARRRDWHQNAQLGAQPSSGRYTVTGRGLGYAVATFTDTGEQRTVYAPTPCA